MMSRNEESSFYINDSLKNMRCYRYGEKCGNSLLHNSKLKTRNFYIIYHTYRMLYKAKQKQNKSKTTAKLLAQFYVNDDARFIRHIIHIFCIYGRYPDTW